MSLSFLLRAYLHNERFVLNAEVLCLKADVLLVVSDVSFILFCIMTAFCVILLISVMVFVLSLCFDMWGWDYVTSNLKEKVSAMKEKNEDLEKKVTMLEAEMMRLSLPKWYNLEFVPQSPFFQPVIYWRDRMYRGYYIRKGERDKKNYRHFMSSEETREYIKGLKPIKKTKNTI